MRSTPVDGFRLTYDRAGSGWPVVLLHGWPGDRTDYRDMVPLLSESLDVVIPDLRGFGTSDKHDADPAEQYSAKAQARSIAGLIEELDLERPVIAGYDIGSRTAQTLATCRPDLVGALVVAPPLPGVGRRALDESAQREFWYQAFHQSPLIECLIDGKPDAVRDYLAYIWGRWSGPHYAVHSDQLEHLVSVYGAPGAFAASIAWYRAGAGAVATSLAEATPEPGRRVGMPTKVLWPEHDPLFPREWSDRLDDFFSDVELRYLDGVGHFSPLEAPQPFAAEVLSAADRLNSGKAV
ncbi:epoxide hydrolase (plasmid) [Rhodococcus jostii RHA1]|uniref:Epoxide hydrolase n=1 Tax=Rhodococcus jostii (strain RHA1) TaxID=101510 RepID=Q0RXV9_RHOJR|nr:alpha/beta hydrolase [Rhodococcus jostii]ABG99877.1 epoxide hydrolase [Rhodococcus jostii RHA1]